MILEFFSNSGARWYNMRPVHMTWVPVDKEMGNLEPKTPCVKKCTLKNYFKFSRNQWKLRNYTSSQVAEHHYISHFFFKTMLWQFYRKKQKSFHLHNYFNLHVCLSIRSGVPWAYHLQFLQLCHKMSLIKVRQGEAKLHIYIKTHIGVSSTL